MHERLRVRVGNAVVWFTDRNGGVSRPPYDSLNLTDHVGDTDDAVIENRRRLAQTLAAHDDVPDDHREWVWLRQVHGATVVRARDAGANGREGDAAVTDLAGLPLAIQVADCVPIALVTDDAIGAVHAGWKGLEAGVIERSVETLRDAGAGAVDAWIGPCVMPCHYAFGADELERFVQRFGPSVAGRTLVGDPALDLAAAVEIALRSAGVERVERSGHCTAHDAQRWFSHRRDGTTGRQAMVVARLP